MKAIETEYRGINYRSRLEARWSAFFDDLCWPFVYEAVHLEWYLPDFVLTLPHGPLLLEVKPGLHVDGLRQYTAKVDATDWEHEAVIVGAYPFNKDDSGGAPMTAADVRPGAAHHSLRVICEAPNGPKGRRVTVACVCTNSFTLYAFQFAQERRWSCGRGRVLCARKVAA